MNLSLRKFAAAAAAAITLLLPLSPAASAQAADSAGFTVRAVIPENQIDKNQTYFDLRMEPGDVQTLRVEVQNTSNTQAALDITLHAASTNRNGLIEYTIPAPPDETLVYPFDTIARTSPELTLAPNETKLVDIRVEMPQERFDGVILGGIVFTKRTEPSDAQGFALNNQFAYVIGVKLSETDEPIQNDFELKSIEETLVNYRTAVLANIRNPMPVIVKNADASARVYRGTDQTPKFTAEKTGVDFAPNSTFPLPVEWDGQKLDAGNYRMAVQLTHKDRTWNWEQEFTITTAQAQDINNAALQPNQPAAFGFRHLIWILLLVLVLIAVAFWFGRRSRKSETDRGPSDF